MVLYSAPVTGLMEQLAITDWDAEKGEKMMNARPPPAIRTRLPTDNSFGIPALR